MSLTIVPCLWLDDQAEVAAAFYTELLPRGRILGVARYPESKDNPAGKPRGSVMTIEIEVAGFRFTLLDGGPMFTIKPSISFFLHAPDAQTAEKWFAALLDGGSALMPLGSYPWSECYGWVKDRFGVSWQVIVGQPHGDATIAPCLMFSDAQHGNAQAALELYTRIFPGSEVERVEHYGAEEVPAEGRGLVKHARFRLAGQAMVAMDSHIRHGFGFDEGLSLQVMCKDQAEVDRYWTELSEGGSQGPCGWLKDRFGVSWQVVPEGIVAWMLSEDAAARDRAFDAMMRMKKPDIAALQAAFDGG